MDDNSFWFIIATYFVIFFIVHLTQNIVLKIRDRNRCYFIRKQRSKWKHRLVSAIISFALVSGIVVYVFRFNKESTLFGNIDLNPGDIFVSLSSILICSLAFIYGNRRGERLTKGLKPIIRENVFTSICNQPYRTLRQAYTFPSYGRYPSDYEAFKWREETREFASGKAMWLSIYLLYILVLIEVFIGINIITGGLSLDVNGAVEFAKLIGAMLTVGFLLISLLMIMFHIPIIWIIEFIVSILGAGESKGVEWAKFVIHSILFNASVVGLFRLVANVQ